MPGATNSRSPLVTPCRPAVVAVETDRSRIEVELRPDGASCRRSPSSTSIGKPPGLPSVLNMAAAPALISTSLARDRGRVADIAHARHRRGMSDMDGIAEVKVVDDRAASAA